MSKRVDPIAIRLIVVIGLDGVADDLIWATINYNDNDNENDNDDDTGIGRKMEFDQFRSISARKK